MRHMTHAWSACDSRRKPVFQGIPLCYTLPTKAIGRQPLSLLSHIRPPAGRATMEISGMRCGLNFFPSCRPEYKAGEVYFREALELCELADSLGYATVKIVEHYFRAYGGYSPSPLIFLAAAAQRTRHIRLVTGAVLPAFNHPLKLAAELAMVDCLSGGRLDAGFARAFLPHEFEAFEVSMEESRPRFEEGIAAVRRLWTEARVTFEGRFHRFKDITLLPRPIQKPHPPILVAAISTPESFIWAG